jgi:hypothetical protein
MRNDKRGRWALDVEAHVCLRQQTGKSRTHEGRQYGGARVKFIDDCAETFE